MLASSHHISPYFFVSPDYIQISILWFCWHRVFRTTASTTPLAEERTSVESSVSLFIHILPERPAPSARHGWAVTQQQETRCRPSSARIQAITAPCFLTVTGALQKPANKGTAPFPPHPPCPRSIPAMWSIRQPISPPLLPPLRRGSNEILEKQRPNSKLHWFFT